MAKVQSSTNIELDDINLEEILSFNDYATKQEINLYFPLIDLLSEKHSAIWIILVMYIINYLINTTKHHLLLGFLVGWLLGRVR